MMPWVTSFPLISIGFRADFAFRAELEWVFEPLSPLISIGK